MKHIAKKLFQVSCSMLHEISRSRSRSFFFLVIAFLAGVALHSAFFKLPWLVPVIGIFSCVPVIVLFWGKKESKLPVLGILFIFLGILRFSLYLEPWGNPLAAWENKNLAITGTVIASAQSGHSTIITLRSEEIALGQRREIIKEKIVLFLPQFREYEVGIRLEINCLLRENNGWPRQETRWNCSPSSVREAGKGNLGFGGRIVAGARKAFLDGLNAALPEPQLSLARGLILGNDFGFSPRLSRAFIATGMAHIVAVSGWNVTVITNALFLLLISLGLKRKYSLPILGLFILFYVVLTGSGSSVVRAGVMGALLAISKEVKRPYAAKNAIAAAAGAMVAINPQILIFDIGFILSFSATLGLVFLYPIFRGYIPKKIKIHFLRWSADTLAQTGAATVFTTPVILLVFGNISPVSPLANLLILPAVPLATVAAFLAGVGGLISDTLGRMVGLISWVPITYIINTAELLASFPFANITFSSFLGRILAISLPAAVFAAVCILRRKKINREKIWTLED